jgi:hypothetical protein
MLDQTLSAEMARSISPPHFITQRQYIDKAVTTSPPTCGPIRLSMRMDDAERPWFFKHSDNSKDALIMKNRPKGSFFVRPSSIEHCYSLVWVDEEITDHQTGSLKKKYFISFLLPLFPFLSSLFSYLFLSLLTPDSSIERTLVML